METPRVRARAKMKVGVTDGIKEGTKDGIKIYGKKLHHEIKKIRPEKEM